MMIQKRPPQIQTKSQSNLRCTKDLSQLEVKSNELADERSKSQIQDLGSPLSNPRYVVKEEKKEEKGEYKTISESEVLDDFNF